MTQPDTVERPDTKNDTGTDDDEHFHYVNKNRIIKSVVDGDHVVALCGEVFPVTNVTKLPNPGSPICQECQRLFEKLKP